MVKCNDLPTPLQNPSTFSQARLSFIMALGGKRKRPGFTPDWTVPISVCPSNILCVFLRGCPPQSVAMACGERANVNTMPFLLCGRALPPRSCWPCRPGRSLAAAVAARETGSRGQEVWFPLVFLQHVRLCIQRGPARQRNVTDTHRNLH